jgi:uncharacterized repeat protein (TIGR03803 family)
LADGKDGYLYGTTLQGGALGGGTLYKIRTDGSELTVLRNFREPEPNYSVLPDLIVANPDRPVWLHSWYDKFLSHVDVASAPQAAGAWNSWNMLNQSLSGTLYRLGTYVDDPTDYRWNASIVALSPQALAIVSTAAKLVVLLLVSYAVWPPPGNQLPRHKEFLIAIRGSAIVLGMLLLSPMSSKQHFCVLVLPISVLVVDWLYFGRRQVVTIALALMIFFGMLAGKDVVGASIHKQLNAYGSLTWLTLVCLIACCEVARRARKTPERETQGQVGPQELPHHVQTTSHRIRANRLRSSAPRAG